jgi:SPP1 gp7 family putative phage head morphogenesis protein
MIGLSKIIRIKTNTEFDFSGWEFDEIGWNEQLQNISRPFMREMYELFGAAAYDGLKYKIGEDKISGRFNVLNPYVSEFIDRYSFEFARRVNETTADRLRATMSTVMEQGLNMDEAAKRISDIFDDKNRSMLIARTETIRASNYGALEGYRQTGIVNAKKWLVTKDDRLCLNCRALDGVELPLDGIYTSNSYEDVLAPPLHPNCRCALLSVVDTSFLDNLPEENPLEGVTFWTSGKIGIARFIKGGTGSGNFGHAGRPGEVGGSKPSGEGRSTAPSGETEGKYWKLTNFLPGELPRH